MGWKVTVRRGPEVSRESFDGLEQALAFSRAEADKVRREGRLPTVKAFRDFTPDRRVQARVEVTGPGLLRRPTAGIDVMGDGSLVAFKGAVTKREMANEGLDDAMEKLREALS